VHVAVVLVSALNNVLIAGRDRDQVDRGVADSALGLDLIREATNRCRRSLQDGRFEAMLVVEMDMHRCDDKVMVLMLRGSQSFAEVALVVVVPQELMWASVASRSGPRRSAFLQPKFSNQEARPAAEGRYAKLCITSRSKTI